MRARVNSHDRREIFMRRIQIFIEGGWFGVDEFADMIATAIDSAITDNGIGEDERQITDAERAKILTGDRGEISAMKETLASIDSPHFRAGIVLQNNRVIEAAPIVGYMRRERWTRERVRAYCVEKGWTVSVVWEMDRNDDRRSHRRSRPTTRMARSR